MKSVIITLCLFLLCSARRVQTPTYPESRPNVLLIVLDDVGAEKFDFYHPPVSTPPTPRLSTFAQQGALFTNVYANPLCSPTRTTVLTGKYTFRTGYILPSSEITIAEMLKGGFPGSAKQYQCGAFGKWHVAPDGDAMHPIHQGFDRYVGALENLSDHFDWPMVTADANGFSVTQISGAHDETTFSAGVVRREALSWINATDSPFFAYVCFNPPHAPFQVPPLETVSASTAATINSLGFAPGDDLFGTANDQRAYNWLIEATDTEVGRLIDGITPSKRARTTILIVGDNGTPATVIEGPPYQSSHAKGRVYQQGILVPLIATGFGVENPGIVRNGLVSTVDFWPTIAVLTGATVPPETTIDGVDFSAMVQNSQAPSGRHEVFAHVYPSPGPYTPNSDAPPTGIPTMERAMSDGTVKFVRRWTVLVGPNPMPVTPREEAYNLVDDPLELNDLWPTLNTLPSDVQLRILHLRRSMIALSGF